MAFQKNMNINTSKKELRSENKKEEFWSKTSVWLSTTLFCVFLWGTAFPIVKTGYRVFQINNASSDAVPSLLLFAGLRFSLAGLLTIVFTAISEKRSPFPQNKLQWKDAFILSIPQTIFQYGFFFIGLANTSGSIGSILAGTSSFMTVVLASLIFKNEKMNFLVSLGCVLGLVGVILVGFQGGDNLGFNWLGDGFMLLSAFSTAIGMIISKTYTARNHPRLLSGWNLMMGGLFLIISGLIFGGSINPINSKAWLILLYLATLSSIAFALWTTMLKYHSVSKLSVFKSLIPVMGSIGSAVILKENILQVRFIIALILVMLGIALVNYKREV